MWLLLIHQIPPDPPYLRVKARRRLHRIGALALKSTVYALPAGGPSRSKFEWLAKEVRAGGGEAILCEARFIGGLSDDDVRELFRADRDAHYERLCEDIGEVVTQGPGAGAMARLGRLRRRFAVIQRLDIFAAPGGRRAQRSLDEAESALNPPRQDPVARDALDLRALRGRAWVTREGVHVDRMASAWLIRRFVDPDAEFRFVEPDGDPSAAGEIRFDMYDAEFTHEGDMCTFEVLAQRVAPEDRALREIAEIVHDIDLGDGKFGRVEAAGFRRVVEGIRAAHPRDEDRVEHAGNLLEGIYRSFLDSIPEA